MGEKGRLIYSTIAVGLVGIVTGFFLGGGLLPSQASSQMYNEKTTTSKTELTIVHAHDGISSHEHSLITVLTVTETTPHGTFHDFAAAMAPSITPTAMAPTFSTPAHNEVWVITREFLPRTITVPVGTTITWTNKDVEEHTVTFKNGLLNMRLVTSNSFFSHTFTEPGTFEYYCDPHPEMTGKVVVK